MQCTETVNHKVSKFHVLQKCQVMQICFSSNRNWPYNSKCTFTSSMVTSHSFLFHNIFLQFVIVSVLISIQMHSHHLDLGLPVVLTPSGWLLEDLLGFCSTVYPVYVAKPIQSSHSYESDNVHAFVQSV